MSVALDELYTLQVKPVQLPFPWAVKVSLDISVVPRDVLNPTSRSLSPWVESVYCPWLHKKPSLAAWTPLSSKNPSYNSAFLYPVYLPS